MARILHLAEPAPPEGYFMGVEIPEETNTKSDELVILVRRNDRYIIPKGGLHLHPKDILLIVSERQELMAPEVTEHTNDRLLDRLKKLFR